MGLRRPFWLWATWGVVIWALKGPFVTFCGRGRMPVCLLSVEAVLASAYPAPAAAAADAAADIGCH